MSLYAALFNEEGCHCAQVLVTKEDFRDREHYLHMKDCFENLLREGVVPIVNENDAIAAPGVAFTDNDELAAFIASELGAEAVIMLSSVDGVLTGEGNAIPQICLADADSFEKCVTAERSPSGRGGMARKFEIAKRLMAQGVATHIVNGARARSITDIVNGDYVGTRFIPDKKLSAPKRRIAHSEGLAAGAVYVNKGAEEVLLSDRSASLLPVGVVRVEGAFRKGDAVEILTEAGKRLGFGIAQYGIEKARELVGKKGARALIHCDYLFIG
jgi:glutamate 5-kinase